LRFQKTIWDIELIYSHVHPSSMVKRVEAKGTVKVPVS